MFICYIISENPTESTKQKQIQTKYTVDSLNLLQILVDLLKLSPLLVQKKEGRNENMVSSFAFRIF